VLVRVPRARHDTAPGGGARGHRVRLGATLWAEACGCRARDPAHPRRRGRRGRAGPRRPGRGKETGEARAVRRRTRRGRPRGARRDRSRDNRRPAAPTLRRSCPRGRCRRPAWPPATPRRGPGAPERRCDEAVNETWRSATYHPANRAQRGPAYLGEHIRPAPARGARRPARPPQRGARAGERRQVRAGGGPGPDRTGASPRPLRALLGAFSAARSPKPYRRPDCAFWGLYGALAGPSRRTARRRRSDEARGTGENAVHRRPPEGGAGLAGDASLGRPAVVPRPDADRDRSALTGAADVVNPGLADPHPLQALAVVVRGAVIHCRGRGQQGWGNLSFLRYEEVRPCLACHSVEASPAIVWKPVGGFSTWPPPS
jgi:hypothetical protein